MSRFLRLHEEPDECNLRANFDLGELLATPHTFSPLVYPEGRNYYSPGAGPPFAEPPAFETDPCRYCTGAFYQVRCQLLDSQQVKVTTDRGWNRNATQS